jgi:hypothetical protein
MAHTVNTATTEAVDTLAPLVKAATQAAETKRADALARLDRSNVRGRLLAALEAVDTANADPAVIQQLAAMVPQHRLTVPNVLPGVLMAKYRANELKDERYAQEWCMRSDLRRRSGGRCCPRIGRRRR